MLSVPIDEASAKIRSGPPLPGTDEDGARARWNGVLLVALAAGEPIADTESRVRTVSASLSPWRRPDPAR